MQPIPRTYLVDEQNRPVAVQLDVATFEHIEQLLEDYALGTLLDTPIDPEDAERLTATQARAFYQQLPKSEAP